MKAEHVTTIPHRLEPFGRAGWTVVGFADSRAAAAWYAAHRNAAMPCWKRWEVIDGCLMQVR